MNFKHMVVRIVPDGLLICSASSSSQEPAVYEDTPPAELRCSQLREASPDDTYRVLSFQVL